MRSDFHLWPRGGRTGLTFLVTLILLIAAFLNLFKKLSSCFLDTELQDSDNQLISVHAILNHNFSVSPILVETKHAMLNPKNVSFEKQLVSKFTKGQPCPTSSGPFSQEVCPGHISTSS